MKTPIGPHPVRECGPIGVLSHSGARKWGKSFVEIHPPIQGISLTAFKFPYMAAPIHIGTQGWNYNAWLGPFFPDGTRSADFLTTYARAFRTVEVDSTFYAVPAESTFRSWYDRTPDDFIFALKFPQAVTHEGRLRDAIGTTELYFERIRTLGSKLGPTLIQLGPDFGPSEYPALAAFLPKLPKDLKVAVEFRQRGWITEDVLALLRDHNVALTLTDGPWIPRKWALKLVERPTSNFSYIRWMGPDRSIVDHSHIQVDRMPELRLWRDAIRELATRVDVVYGYMSNFFAGHAPKNARDMQELLGIPNVDPELLGEQIRLL
jgi:uncharacterized protein YecE (DUF72 family)